MSVNKKPAEVRYARATPSECREDIVKNTIEISGKPVDFIASQNGIELYTSKTGGVLYGIKDNRVIIKLWARACGDEGYIDFSPLIGIKKDDE